MHARGLDAVLEQRQQTFGAFRAVAIGTVGFGIFDEVRVAVVQAEIGEAILACFQRIMP